MSPLLFKFLMDEVVRGKRMGFGGRGRQSMMGVGRLFVDDMAWVSDSGEKFQKLMSVFRRM